MLALSLPKPLDHLRRGESRPGKIGRAGRFLVGSFKSVGRRRSVLKNFLTRRALLHFLLAEQATRHNEALAEAGTLTAAIYLREVVKAPADYIKKYASAFGRKAADAYRELFGAEPAMHGLTVIGNHPRLAAIATYGPHAHMALAAATRTHKKTADLIIGA